MFVKYKVNAPAVSAATPSNEVTFVILEPIVLQFSNHHLRYPAADCRVTS
jgi:hypothetical protein